MSEPGGSRDHETGAGERQLGDSPPKDPTVRDVFEMLGMTYTKEGVFHALTSLNHTLGDRVPVDMLDTVEGRREVYGWAMALAEGVFT